MSTVPSGRLLKPSSRSLLAALFAVATISGAALAQTGSGGGGGGSVGGGGVGGGGGATSAPSAGGVGGSTAAPSTGSGVTATPGAASPVPGRVGSGVPGPTNPTGVAPSGSPIAPPNTLPRAQAPSSPTEAGSAARPGQPARPRDPAALPPGVSPGPRTGSADTVPQPSSSGGVARGSSEAGLSGLEPGTSPERSLDICLNDWDQRTHMSRGSWEAACRRTSERALGEPVETPLTR